MMKPSDKPVGEDFGDNRVPGEGQKKGSEELDGRTGIRQQITQIDADLRDEQRPEKFRVLSSNGQCFLICVNRRNLRIKLRRRGGILTTQIQETSKRTPLLARRWRFIDDWVRDSWRRFIRKRWRLSLRPEKFRLCVKWSCRCITRAGC